MLTVRIGDGGATHYPRAVLRPFKPQPQARSHLPPVPYPDRRISATRRNYAPSRFARPPSQNVSLPSGRGVLQCSKPRFDPFEQIDEHPSVHFFERRGHRVSPWPMGMDA